MEIRLVQVTRYVTPLREGGSLPAIAEADDGFLYVLKFRGAGQGVKALVAEFIGSELARALQLKVPELVLAQLDESFGRTEPDEEIQDLLKASTGLNLALHYLSGSITYDPAVNKVDSLLASKIVWLDALITNIDRTARNTNMLLWHQELWLIDQGAAFYFHHNWDNRATAYSNAFKMIKDHVLLPYATQVQQADTWGRELLTKEIITAILNAVPEEWLATYEENRSVADVRNAYADFLLKRLDDTSIFLKSITDAQQAAFI